jgi:hypothetical protein
MQFDLTGLLIFLALILPGFVAQKAQYSVVPRSLKPLSSVGEIGEFILTGVWIHLFLLVGVRFVFWIFAEGYFAILENTFYYSTPRSFLWGHRVFVLAYFVLSLAAGYGFGFVQGVFVLKQPIRSWLVRRPFPKRMLLKLGVPGFLQDDPVWYFVLKQKSPETMVFLEVEMKNAAGIYAGTLKSYGILDDSVKSKDFYLEDVHFKENRAGAFVRLDCDGVLVNFEDAVTIQVVKVEPEEALAQEAKEASKESGFESES